MKLGWLVLSIVLSLFSGTIMAAERPGLGCELQMLAGSAVSLDRVAFLNDLAATIESNRAEITRILSAVDTPRGVEYEIHQATQTLRGAITTELEYLNHTRVLENVAVYGSTNIPLYTLVLHALIPSTVAENVWFRTPAVSRQTYLALFELLRSRMPQAERLDRVHLLTEPRDVQYDSFRKVHVLGLHKNGKRLVRNPSEMVIFTGNPETGRRIFQTNANRLSELSNGGTTYEQVFLMFGSGINPLVITRDAQARIPAAVEQLVAFIRINSAQDCIAPNFSLVHESMTARLLDTLRPALSALRLGTSPGDHTADYQPLVFSESTDALVEYRQTYRRYLATPDAQIDPVTRAVEPHVFIFPIEMMNQMALEQHYAPFIVFFEYGSAADLRRVARDPRILSHAMFATIFGEPGREETMAAIQLFEHSGHGVFVNQDALAEENGNLPFGGAGENASSVVRVRVEADGSVQLEQRARPLLFSLEALRWFPLP